MTFYLKYRPQSLDDLHEDAVRVTLQKIVIQKEMPHAFLFSGPKGTGKTSAARILAKIINCESTDTKLRGKDLANPCNECEMCKSITRGENIDVIEMDAASHRGIEDVRAIRDGIKLAPARAKKKIYIIDEAHMLTTEASNALLKTLEEPPSHVVFILATTNPEKLIDTIRSRVTNVVFKKATANEIVKSLSKIADKEGVKVENSTLSILSGYSDGSFRDAIKIFEQVVTEGVKLDKESLENFLSSRKSFDLDKFILDLKKRDTKTLIASVEDATQKGASPRNIISELLVKLRANLLSSLGFGEETKNGMAVDDLIELIKIFSDAYSKIPLSPIEQLPVEVAIVEWCEGEKSIRDIKSTKSIKSEEVVKETVTIETEKVAVKDKGTTNTAATEEENTDTGKTIKDNDQKVEVKFNGKNIDNLTWTQILAAIKPAHASTEALLRAAKPLGYDGSTLTLGVFYKFHKEHLESHAHRKVLEDALSEKFGSEVRIACTLTEPDVTLNKISSSVHTDQVVLTEVKNENIPSNIPLTETGDNDIMSIAEKIFSS